MEETGVTNVADPLGGAWYVEALTDAIEAEAEAIFTRIREMGSDGSMTSGILRGIEDGWFMAEIADAAFAYQTQLEKGEKRVVGVNVNADTVASELEILRVSHQVELDQVAALERRKAGRDAAAVERSLAELKQACSGDTNLVPLILAASRAEATLGEICGAMRDVWGDYREPARF
jgi:methylmalonyl-CoA mutase N-terminal domain/subunit